MGATFKEPEQMVAATKTSKTSVIAQVTNRLSQSTGSMIDAMWAVREEKRELEVRIKELNEKLETYEADLTAKLAAEGMAKATGTRATVSISESVVASFPRGDADWKLFYAYIKKTGYFHLLHRRVSDEAYRELLTSGKQVPGITPFTKKRLNLRVVST
jgi:predicted nuclease of restriction endonuclease-like RecB superfamily